MENVSSATFKLLFMYLTELYLTELFLSEYYNQRLYIRNCIKEYCLLTTDPTLKGNTENLLKTEAKAIKINVEYSDDERQNIKRKLEEDFARIIDHLNLNLEDEHLSETPHRIAKAFVNDIFYGLFNNPPDMKAFQANGHSQMIISKDILFYSMCSHHFLPFFGTISIGYIPDKKLAGLSKFARIVDYFARRPQVQERLSDDIVNFIQEKLQPKGVGVYISGRHLCQEQRGIRTPSTMITTSLRGSFLESGTTKAEFLRSIGL